MEKARAEQGHNIRKSREFLEKIAATLAVYADNYPGVKEEHLQKSVNHTPEMLDALSFEPESLRHAYSGFVGYFSKIRDYEIFGPKTKNAIRTIELLAKGRVSQAL